MKSISWKTVQKFTDIPNVGPRMADDFKILGMKTPADLKNQDALKMYRKIEKITGHKHDPCVLDTYMAVIDFANGAEARPWWHYTSRRKKMLE